MVSVYGLLPDRQVGARTKVEAIPAYNGDGLAFNGAKPIMNETHFTTAIYMLIDFNTIESTIL